MLPLYQFKTDQHLERLVEKCESKAHPGLLFDRYPKGWGKTWHEKLADDPKRDPKLTLLKLAKDYDRERLRNGLEAALMRQKALWALLVGEELEATTQWRFVSGLGNGHPYGTGFLWHRTLGVPYIPGSSVKGMVRAWAEQWCDDETISQETVNALFGPPANQTEHEANAGSLIFFDALPTEPPALDVDILNPHYKPYYDDKSGEVPPADYYNPVPVQFLTLAPGQTLRFFLAAKPGAYPRLAAEQRGLQMKSDVTQGLKLLADALEYLGAGGKTAVGYGQMQETDQSQRQRQQQADKAAKQREQHAAKASLERDMNALELTGLAREVYTQSKLQHWQNDKSVFLSGAESFLPQIEKLEDPVQQHQAVDIIKENLEHHDKGILEKPEKKKGKLEKPAYKPRPINIANRLLALVKK